MTKEEIAHNEQFLLLPQYVQLYSINTLSHIEIFRIFAYMISMSSAVNLSNVAKGLSYLFYIVYETSFQLILILFDVCSLETLTDMHCLY